MSDIRMPKLESQDKHAASKMSGENLKKISEDIKELVENKEMRNTEVIAYTVKYNMRKNLYGFNDAQMEAMYKVLKAGITKEDGLLRGVTINYAKAKNSNDKAWVLEDGLRKQAIEQQNVKYNKNIQKMR